MTEDRIDPADPACQLLDLAARINGAAGDPQALRSVLDDCRAWFQCTDALAQAVDREHAKPGELDRIADVIGGCAEGGTGGCGGAEGDRLKRGRCAALVPHLRAAIDASRNRVRAEGFERMAPTWIVDRHCRILERNANARALVEADDPMLRDAEGVLALVDAAASRGLRERVAGLEGEARFAWRDVRGRDGVLTLIATGDRVRIVLNAEPSVAELAATLAATLSLTGRQSELAALLVTGHSLAAAAREMQISVDTAKDHLERLRQRTETRDRRALIRALRGATCR